ncbi:MAG TPA: 2-amino-4-hydroxy-6-hydroxymethyldihydropteridine diphosphokinase, partial [Mariniflexile sp.]|nr:2-amino-4-hydroxy-6-hydroxymethyldihydropteridine diphosphokinase [Mariniflexile sp.]
MAQAKTFYIALGSNKGDKFKNLQEAIDLIYLKIGTISRISKVYKSPALGFESDDFFNACLVVESDLQPETVLQEFLAIETRLGRVRTGTAQYEARTI